MMLAWLSSSENTTSPARSSVGQDADVRRVAGVEQPHAVTAQPVRDRALERDVRVAGFPTINRDAPAPAPLSSSAVAAARTSRRIAGEPEVVVR